MSSDGSVDGAAPSDSNLMDALDLSDIGPLLLENIGSEMIDELAHHGEQLVSTAQPVSAAIAAQPAAAVNTLNDVNTALAKLGRLPSGAFARSDADALLRQFVNEPDSPLVADIPVRQVENRVRIRFESAADAFFVTGATSGSVAGSKRKCADSIGGSGPGASSADDVVWVRFGASSASGSSLKDEKTPGPPFVSSQDQHEGILKKTGTIKSEHKAELTKEDQQFLEANPISISIYQIIGIEGHWGWEVPELLSRDILEVKNVVCKTFLKDDPKSTKLVVASRKKRVAKPSSSLMPMSVAHEDEQPVIDARFGTVDCADLRINGISVLDYIRREADLGEWMERRDEEEPIYPGDVVECRGGCITKVMTHAPGGMVFVVSSDPAWAGNTPKEPCEAAKGNLVAFLGRVPVRVGEADTAIDSLLVPSGRSDGLARSVSADELMKDQTLREACFGVVWDLLPPDDSGCRRVLAFVSAHPTRTFGQMFHGNDEIRAASTMLAACRPERHTLRPYQQESLERAKRSNTLVCLDTGMGKTLIASRLIDHVLSITPQKKVIFVVPTRALVKQQAEAIRKDCLHVAHVTEICGMEIDGWDAARWAGCVQESDVLLGTPAVFHTALATKGFISLAQFCLIVFDEVHNAVGGDPMANLMNDIYWPAKKQGAAVPRILGLTATFVAGKLTNIGSKRKQLEALMDSAIFCPSVQQASANDKFFCVDYPPDSLCDYSEFARTVIERLSGEFAPLLNSKDVEKTIKHAAHVFEQLGMSGFCFYFAESVAYELEETAKKLLEIPHLKSVGEKRLLDLPVLRRRFRDTAEQLGREGSLTTAPRTSAKCVRLLDLVREEFVAHRANPSFKGIVFVEQIALTYPLTHLLEHDQHLAALGVKALPVSGGSSMSKARLEAHLRAFKQGEVRLLVCTAALEEGIDVSDCELVIRFSKFETTKSHLQGSGRARHRDARIFYFDNEPTHEVAQAERMKQAAGDSSLQLDAVQRMERMDLSMREVEGFYPFRPAGGGEHTITLHNAVGVVHEYCCKVLGQSINLDEAGICVFETKLSHSSAPQERRQLAEVRYPSPDGVVVVTAAEVAQHWKEVGLGDVLDPDRSKSMSSADKEKRRFLFSVAVRMHALGHLGSDNQPTGRALRDTKAAYDEGRLIDERLLGLKVDAFAKDSLTSAKGLLTLTSASAAPAAMEVEPSPSPQPKGLLPPPPQSSTNFKGELQELAMKKWRKPSQELLHFECERLAEQSFRASVALLQVEGGPSFQGKACTGKKAAEQSAAEVALRFLKGHLGEETRAHE